MTFSYSRLTAFDSCKYKWLLKYLLNIKELNSGYFASYGTFLHDIFARFYRGEESSDSLATYYLANYFSQVVGKPQKASTAANYFNQGYRAVNELCSISDSVLGVEQEVRWTLGDRDYIGYIDLISKNDDGIVVIDHKNRDLKPRSNRKKQTKSDVELEEYLRQLYLYAIPIKEQYGEYPTSLQFNCYRTGVLIKEPFDKQAFEQTKQWAIDKANEIEGNDDWSPTLDYFGCKYLCGVNHECEYYNTGR